MVAVGRTLAELVIEEFVFRDEWFVATARPLLAPSAHTPESFGRIRGTEPMTMWGIRWEDQSSACRLPRAAPARSHCFPSVKSPESVAKRRCQASAAGAWESASITNSLRIASLSPSWTNAKGRPFSKASQAAPAYPQSPVRRDHCREAGSTLGLPRMTGIGKGLAGPCHESIQENSCKSEAG